MGLGRHTHRDKQADGQMDEWTLDRCIETSGKAPGEKQGHVERTSIL